MFVWKTEFKKLQEKLQSNLKMFSQLKKQLSVSQKAHCIPLNVLHKPQSFGVTTIGRCHYIEMNLLFPFSTKDLVNKMNPRIHLVVCKVSTKLSVTFSWNMKMCLMKIKIKFDTESELEDYIKGLIQNISKMVWRWWQAYWPMI